LIFIRYIFIQVIAYILEMAVFIILIKSSLLGLLLANVGAKLAAGISAFMMHRKFTFKSNQSGSLEKPAFRYFLLLSINIPISSAVLYLIVGLIPSPEMTKFISDLFCLVLTYIASKKLVFIRSKGNGGNASPGSTT
jgi:putative flippase GtrA